MKTFTAFAHIPRPALKAGLSAVAALGIAACSSDAPPPSAEAPAAKAEAEAAHHAHAATAHDLGAVDFGVSCAEPVRAGFNRALGYMHHMMYEESRAAFRQVVQQDPECAMGYWGVATTLFQPMWPTRPSADDLQEGWALTQRARELGPETERDNRLLAATEAFFREPDGADWWTRIGRWADRLEAAYRAHPDDIDTAALYALSRLALAYVAEDRDPLHAEASRVLLAIYDHSPMHPGAIHYLIHANDAEGRAGESLDVVRSYSHIAPDVPHALHMPTHVFVRLGEWPEVIEWNAKSAEAALKFPAGDAISHHYIHAVDYQVYAHLQRGEDAAADKVARAALARERHQPTFVSAFHAAAIPARLAVERRQWQEAARLQPRTPDYLPWDGALWPEGTVWFARGLGAVHTGELDAAREADQRMVALRDRATAAGEKGFATYIEVDRLILAGWLAHLDGRNDKAVSLVRKAAELEGTVEKHPVSPGAVYPPYEALGDLLLHLERAEEALSAYQAADQRWPGRYHTLLGAARAAEAAGQAEVAQRYYAALLGMVGDTARKDLEEARQFVAERS